MQRTVKHCEFMWGERFYIHQNKYDSMYAAEIECKKCGKKYRPNSVVWATRHYVNCQILGK